MSSATYNGIFLAPETIVVFPGFTPAESDDFLRLVDADGARVREDARPGAAACCEDPAS